MCLSAADACRRLTHLTSLAVNQVEVWLPALACIAPQLTHLNLATCRLQTGSGDTDIFAACERLTKLDLELSCLDNTIGSVLLPSLKELLLIGITYQLASGGEQHYECVKLFAPGCPECMELSFTYFPADVADCRAFCKLESVEVAFDPDDLNSWEWWEVEPPSLLLPSTVTCLECQSTSGSFYCDVAEPDHLHMYALLGLAANCISAGVSLRRLSLANCATYVGPLADDTMLEADADDLDDFYVPLARSLHGIRQLCLFASPRCAQDAIDTIVLHAPDVGELMIGVQRPAAVHTLSRRVECCHLQKLEVCCNDMEKRSAHAQPQALDLTLTTSADLTSISIGELMKNVVGDTVAVLLVDCCAGAVISPVLSEYASCVELSIDKQGVVDELGNATVTFDWAADEAWHARVEWV
jgi:hypothetical protein